MATRFQRNLGYSPQPTQTGAADVASLLASKLQRFGGLAADVMDERAAARGTAEGAQAGAVTAPPRRSEFTVRGQAFSRAAEKAHAAAVDTEVRTKLLEFAEAHPSDPDAFEARVAGFQKGLLSQADPTLRPAIEQELAVQGQRLRMQIADRKRGLIAEQTLADLNAGVEGAASGALGASRAGDLDLAEHERGKVADLLTSQVRTPENPFGLYSADEVRQKLAALDAEMDDEVLLGGFQKALGETPTPETIAAATAQLAAFRAAEAASLGLSPERKDAVTRKLEASLVDAGQAYQRRTDLETGENAMERGRAYGDLYRKVQNGEARAVDIEAAFQSGLITPQTRGVYLAEMDRLVAAGKAKADALGKVAGALAGNGWLDPKDTQDKAAVDAYYAQMVEGADPLSPEMLTRTVDLAEQTGIIPETVRSLTRSFQRSPDPNRVVAAAEMVGRLEEKAGQAIEDIPKDDRAFASMVNAYMAAGTDPTRAVELARETVFKTDPDVRKRWDAEAGERAKEGNLREAVADFYDVDETAIPPELEAKYERMVRGYYTRTRDWEQSQKLAATDLKRVFGPTGVGHPRLMQYPPEALYGLPGEDTSWMQADFEKTLRDAGYDPERAFIQEDEETARKERPDYAVFVMGEDGYPQPLLGKRWAPSRALAMQDREAELATAQAALMGAPFAGREELRMAAQLGTELESIGATRDPAAAAAKAKKAREESALREAKELEDLRKRLRKYGRRK